MNVSYLNNYPNYEIDFKNEMVITQIEYPTFLLMNTKTTIYSLTFCFLDSLMFSCNFLSN